MGGQLKGQRICVYFQPIPWTARGSNQSIRKEINPAYIFTERTDPEANLRSPDAKSQLVGKDPVAGKD